MYSISDPARSKRGAAFSEAFSHSKLLSTKNETPGKVVVLKHTILSQLPDSERNGVLSLTPLEGSGSGAWRGPKEYWWMV